MDARGNRRPVPQRPLLFPVLFVSAGALLITYVLLGRHLRSFDKVADTLAQRMEAEAVARAASMQAVLSAIRNQSESFTSSFEERSEMQILQISRLSRELRNHSRLVAAAMEAQGDLRSAEIRSLARDVRLALQAQPQDGQAMGKIMELFDNQTRYSVASLRAGRRLEKSIVEVLTMMRDISDSRTESQSSVDKTLQEMLSAMRKHTQIQEAAQETLDALSALLTNQQAGSGSTSTSTEEQEKIHAVLKALVAHLRNQDRGGEGGSAPQLEAVITLLRNQTSMDSVARELRFQSDSISRLRERLLNMEAKLPTLTDLANLKRAERGAGEGEGEEGVGGQENGLTPELQGAIIGLLQEVRKLTVQMAEVREKVTAMEGETRGDFQASGGQGSGSVLQTLLLVLRNQTRLLSSLDLRVNALEKKLGGSSGEGEALSVNQVEEGKKMDGDGENVGEKDGAGEKEGETEVEKVGQKDAEEKREKEGEVGQEKGENEAGTEREKEVKVAAALSGMTGDDPRMTDVSDAGSWRQRQLAGGPPYMRFSGYRVNAATMASVGVIVTGEAFAVESCHWVGRGSTMAGTPETFLAGKEENNNFVVVVIHCTLPADVPSEGGYLVASIGSKEFTLYREEIGEFVPAKVDEPLPYFMTVCVAPLSRPVRVELLREFVEFHRLQGIDHFVFYNGGGLGDEFKEKFAGDIRRRFVEVAPFDGVAKYEQRRGGELLAFHDCMYSARFSSQWVASLEASEYLYAVPPSPLRAVLERHREQGWLSHGSIWWSSQKCDPPFGEEEKGGGERFSIERMVFRWPYVLCHDTGTFPNRKLCLGGIGDRKLIVNPRKVMRVEAYAAHASDEKMGLDLSTDVLMHLHYQKLLEGSGVLCNEVIPNGKEIVFWWRNYDVQSYAKSLRGMLRCNFTDNGCVAESGTTMPTKESTSEFGTRREEGGGLSAQSESQSSSNTEAKVEGDPAREWKQMGGSAEAQTQQETNKQQEANTSQTVVSQESQRQQQHQQGVDEQNEEIEDEDEPKN